MPVSLHDRAIRLASDNPELRPGFGVLFKRASSWTRQKVVQWLSDEGFYVGRKSYPDSKDAKRMADIISKSRGDAGAALALGVRQAKTIKDIAKAVRRGSAAQSRSEPVMETIAQAFFQRAVELGGGPSMKTVSAPAAPKPKKVDAPAIPTSLLPKGADEWQLYSGTKGVGTAARNLTQRLTSALVSLGKTVSRNQTAAARKKAVIKVVQRISAALDRYADFGASDTEPRYVARSTMRRYLEMILGVSKGFLFGSYPEVEQGLDYI
jgi:hypothetical protein